MGLFFFKWSRTAASNATADAQINFAEGQAPSSVNDSARALMASAAGFRDDISGAIATGGSSTAFTVTSYQVFDSLANMSGHMIAFVPHTTSGAAPTLNVDGLGAKNLRQFPSTDMPAGVLVQGTPYVATYNNSDSSWYLRNSFVNPYQVPIAGGLDYWGTSTPNSAFAFPAGQAISRTTYSVLFGIMGTTYGTGDGSTTFNLPDKTGRVSAMKESSATRLTSTYFGASGATMGATGGSESTSLTAAQIPSLTSTGSFTSSGSTFVASDQDTTTFSTNAGGPFGWRAWNTGASVTRGSVTGSLSVTSSGTSGSGHRTVQPTIICNYISRSI
jgi:microcystin-dependent protein